MAFSALNIQYVYTVCICKSGPLLQQTQSGNHQPMYLIHLPSFRSPPPKKTFCVSTLNSCLKLAAREQQIIAFLNTEHGIKMSLPAEDTDQSVYRDTEHFPRLSDSEKVSVSSTNMALYPVLGHVFCLKGCQRTVLC